jgi:predicted enzyme related to lactoylglutathione lyase
MEEKSRYEPGEICWVGLAASDPVAAASFYTGLFGWEAEEPLVRLAGHDVALLYRQTPEARAAGVAPHWTTYISVADSDEAAGRVRDLGGVVVRGPFDAMGAGRVTAIRDPTGAIVSLWEPVTRIGATIVDEVGALCGCELVTPDAERARAFFAELLGAEPAVRSGAPPEWIPAFGVASAADSTRKAEGLGGRALGDGLIADPQGATFRVLEVLE